MKEFLKISKYAGMREDLVQAGGGNSSVKISTEKMLIKASGYQLADVTETEGYAVINPSIITEFFANISMDYQVTKEEENKLLKQSYLKGKRPSIETFLHCITTGRVTLHTHAVLVTSLTSRKDGMKILQRFFPEALMVPYATPGIQLAVSCFQAYQRSGRKTAELIFLQNHGFVVSGNTALEVIERTESVLQIIAGILSFDYRIYADSTILYQAVVDCGLEENLVYQVQNRKVEKAYQLLGENIWELTICPDSVVYCGRKILQVEEGIEKESIQQFQKQYGIPCILLYRSQFYILAPSIKKAKEIESILAFSAEVAIANQGKEIFYLTEQEQGFLLDWDAEIYRKNIK